MNELGSTKLTTEMVNMMSNTYNENTQITVSQTLNSFLDEEQKRESALTCAKQELFYAEKAVADSDYKLRNTLNLLKTKKFLNKQSLEVQNRGVNLHSTVANCRENADTLVENISTAATDVQVATRAITRVSADIGAAYNLVSASDMDTDIYHLTQYANDFVRKTALKAEQASLQVTEASADAAEIIARQLDDEMTAVKKNIDGFYDDSNKQVQQLTELEKKEYAAWQAQSNREQMALGKLADANKEQTASIKAFLGANEHLNLALTAHVVNSQQIHVSFTPYQIPFLNQLESDSGEMDLEVKYYATIVPNENKGLFRYHEAEINFQERKSSTYVEVKPAAKPEPTPDQVPDTILPAPYSAPENDTKFIDDAALAELNTLDLSNITDASGDAIEPGRDYVVFLYIELPQAFKKFVNNYSDLISAPGQHFKPADKLILPEQLALKQQETRYEITRQPETDITVEGHDGNQMVMLHGLQRGHKEALKPVTELGDVTLEFTIDHDLPDGVEYRALFLPADSPAVATQSAIAEHLNKTKRPHLNFYFDQEIAEQIPASNYTTGEIVYQQDHFVPQNKVAYHYVFDINDASTDVFADPLQSGKVYYVVILTLVDKDHPAYRQYIAQMTTPTDFWFVIPSFPLDADSSNDD